MSALSKLAAGVAVTLSAALARGQTVVPISIDQDPEADFPIAAEYTADGTRIVIAHRDTQMLSVLDAATRSHLFSVPTGGSSLDVAVSVDGSIAVTANEEISMSIVDLTTQSLMAVVPLSGTHEPRQVLVTSDGARAIVMVYGYLVSVVDVATATEVLSFPVQGSEMLLSPDDVTLVTFGCGFGIYDSLSGALLAGYGPDWTECAAAADLSTDGRLLFVGFKDGVALVDMDTLVPGSKWFTTKMPAPYTYDVFITPDKTTGLRVGNSGLEYGTQVWNLTTGLWSGWRTDIRPADEMLLSHDEQYLVAFTEQGAKLQVVGLGPGLPKLSELPIQTNGVVPSVAISPTAHEFVVVDPIDEHAVFYDTNGAGSHLVDHVSTGAPPEGDRPLALAVTADGSLAVTANHGSDNITFLDLDARAVLGYASVGGGPTDVELTPDETVAVVACHLDESLSVVDVAGRTELARLPVGDVPVQVITSQDGQRAYVMTAGDGDDQVLFVNLAGGSSSVVATVGVPDVGDFEHHSGFGRMAASDDGTVLAVCSRWSDSVTFVDTAAMAIANTVAVPEGPVGAAFHPDGDRCYVASGQAQAVTELRLLAGTWTVTVSQASGATLRDVVLDEQGEFAYVVRYNGVRVLETSTMAWKKIVDLPGKPVTAARMGSELFVACESSGDGGKLQRVRMAGARSEMLPAVTLAEWPVDLAVAPAASRAVVAWDANFWSRLPDGIELVEFGDASRYCDPAIPNSTGVGAVIDASGTFLAGQPMRLDAHQLPPSQFGYFLASMDGGSVIPPGSQGRLCLGGSIARFVQQVQSSGPGGQFGIDADTNAIPTSPPSAVQPGETWNFQAWFRDVNPTSTSNFTDAVAVQFD